MHPAHTRTHILARSHSLTHSFTHSFTHTLTHLHTLSLSRRIFATLDSADGYQLSYALWLLSEREVARKTDDKAEEVYRFRAKRERLKWLQRLLPASQGQKLALTVLYVPYSLDDCSQRAPSGSFRGARLRGGSMKRPTRYSSRNYQFLSRLSLSVPLAIIRELRSLASFGARTCAEDRRAS